VALRTSVFSDRARAGSRAGLANAGPTLITFALLLSFPWWSGWVGLYPYLGTVVVIWMIYALGFNLLFGYAGLPSFGHGAFFGVGAYAYGLCFPHLGQSSLGALAGAALAGGIGAALIGLFVAHRRGIYFALMTIACGQVFWFVASKWHSVTGGEDGLLNLGAGLSLGGHSFDLRDNVTLYYFVVTLLALVVALLWVVVHSPFGLALQAIRMNETRARFVGYDVWRTKHLVFALSGALAGLAGGLLAISQQSAYPDVMSLHGSGLVVMVTLIGGGTVSFWGPVVGAVLFVVARDVLGSLTDTWLLWYGLLFVVVVLFQPEGIAGVWQRFAPRLTGKKPNLPAPEEKPSIAVGG